MTTFSERIRFACMKIFSFSILFFIACISGSGCNPAALQDSSSAKKERLTLQDLQPPDSQYLQPQIVYNWVEFEIDGTVIKNIESALKQFSPESIDFQKAELYKQNGISVFFGKNEQGALLLPQLSQLEAKHIKRTIKITMEKTPEFYAMSSFGQEKTVCFTTIGNQTTKRTYPAGQFGFMIESEQTAQQDQVKMICQPAFVPAIGLPYYRDESGANRGTSYLPPGIFKTTMSEGDFLIVAPNRSSLETTLDKILFGQEDKKAKYHIYILVFIRAGYENSLMVK